MKGPVARPSLRLRALIAIALLLGFYAVTIGIALLLLAFGAMVAIASVWSGSHSNYATLSHFNYGTVIGVAICVVPAFMLLYGVFAARAPPFKEPGRELGCSDAPKLFDMLSELAVDARTRAPSRVFLATMPNVGVTQVGGFLGIGSKRILILGVPMLHLLRVGQLRAVLAHEYGHFVGSDTQLAGIHAYTHALFVSVLRATTVRPPFAIDHFAFAAGAQVAAKIGTLIARIYARIYFRITHALSRRQELAADALAAKLTGPATIASALEATFASALYAPYIGTEVLDAVRANAMPTDLMAGFTKFQQAIEGMEDGKVVLAKLREERTDPFDSHPALSERLEALSLVESKVDPRPGDDDVATSLVDIDVDSWLVEATMAMFERPLTMSGSPPPLELMSWDEIPTRAFEPRTRDAARKIAEALHTTFPDAKTIGAMFAAIVGALERGGLPTVATALEPRIGGLAPHEQHGVAQRIVAQSLALLFEGALLEKGGHAKASFAQPVVIWSYEGSDVLAGKLAAEAFGSAEGRKAIGAWATRLG